MNYISSEARKSDVQYCKGRSEVASLDEEHNFSTIITPQSQRLPELLVFLIFCLATNVSLTVVAFEDFVDRAAAFAIWSFGDEGHEEISARLVRHKLVCAIWLNGGRPLWVVFDRLELFALWLLL